MMGEIGFGVKSEKECIVNTYKKMYDGMIEKDEIILRNFLDDSFVLVHMTGMRLWAYFKEFEDKLSFVFYRQI